MKSCKSCKSCLRKQLPRYLLRIGVSTILRYAPPLWLPWMTIGPEMDLSSVIAPPVTPRSGALSMIFTPFRMTVAWRSQRMASTCCHSPACRSPFLHLADVCAPCAAAKRPMTNSKRLMTKRHAPHDQNKTPHDETTWIARVKLNAIFPVSVGTDPAKSERMFI